VSTASLTPVDEDLNSLVLVEGVAIDPILLSTVSNLSSAHRTRRAARADTMMKRALAKVNWSVSPPSLMKITISLTRMPRMKEVPPVLR